MSIFKDSFHPSIQEQLKTRQTAINNRTPQNLTYYNSRNAWIRLSSSVNVYNGKGSPTDTGSYTNDLAKQYILQGGILNNENARAGIGNFSNAYSNVGSDGTLYRLGIRPMPGITSVDVKSLGAYGSIREATVNFQCWDIKQLEDLELLYMRPGYSVLLEWGWSPYLNNNGDLVTTVDYTDIINTKWVKEDLYSQQYARATDGNYVDVKGNKKSVTGFKGNVDSMYGTVKNYSWKARMDGGYDCQTTIISLGEVIESLKVNYAPLDNLSSVISGKGLISNNIVSQDNTVFTVGSDSLSKSYSNNILAGIFTELYAIGRRVAIDNSNEVKEGKPYVLTDKKYGINYDLFIKNIEINSNEQNKSNQTKTVGNSPTQVYITLETLTHLLNNYVLLRDKNSKTPYTSISVLEKGATNIDPVSGSGYLLSLAHPLELSIDPTVCLIKNKLWPRVKFISTDLNAVDPNKGTPASPARYGTANIDENFWRTIATLINKANGDNVYPYTESDALITYVQSIIGSGPNSIENIKEIQRQFIYVLPKSNYNVEVVNGKKLTDYENFYDLLNEGLTATRVGIDKALGVDKYNYSSEDPSDLIFKAAKEDPKIVSQAQLNIENKKIEKTTNDLNDSIENIKFLDKLSKPYFTKDEWTTELGIIGNIYVNVNMLYDLCISDQLKNQDKKEKNDIALYDYIKNVLSRISTAIGEVNNFDLFVDENVVRIIDINYVDRNDPNTAYKNAFVLDVHNLNSVVRSYSLESKIFPDQSTQVAIGAQIGGAALGVDATTLVDFNRNIIDRIIPVKDTPTTNENDDFQSKLKSLVSSLTVLAQYFNDLSYGVFKDVKFDANSVGNYSNSLKDIINYYKDISNSKIKNKSIIPTSLSIEMDGIGGIIIGNLFRIPDDILPKGYKGGSDKIGSKLGYLITRMGHSLQNNDWITRLEAQMIILDEPQGQDPKFSELKIYVSSGGETIIPVGGRIAAVSGNKIKDIEKLVSFRDVTFQVITNLEGGYFHPNMLKDGRIVDSNGYMSGINPKTGQKIPGISPSGETMFGIDRVNGASLRNGAPASWDQFWKLIADNNGPNKWSWLYIPPEPLKSQLKELAIKIMEPLFNTFLNTYVPEKEIQSVIKSDGRLYFNFVYATWNGAGWFKGYANEIRAAYKSGTKDPVQLATLFVRRRSNNIGIIGNKSNNILIATSGAKISSLIGLA